MKISSKNLIQKDSSEIHIQKNLFIGAGDAHSASRALSLTFQELFTRREGYFCMEWLPGFVQPFLHSGWQNVCKGESNNTGVFLCQGGAFYFETISIVLHFWLWRRCLSNLTMRTVNFSFWGEVWCSSSIAGIVSHLPWSCFCILVWLRPKPITFGVVGLCQSGSLS